MEASKKLPVAVVDDRGAEPSVRRTTSEIVRKSRHLEQLDPLRGVAILLVIVFHSTMFTMDRSLLSAPGFDGSFYRVSGWGWVGVDLFFVLSGFLITRILVRSKGLPRFLTNFYARRSLRIFPLYFATLAVWTIVTQLGVSNSFGATPWLWTYTSNLLIGWRGWAVVPVSVNHFWSLAVEEQFYLVWPFTVLLFARPALLRVCGAMLLLSALARVACVLSGYRDAATVLPICRADSLLAGAAVALLLGESDLPSPKLQSVARGLVWFGGGAALLLATWRGGQFDTADPWVACLGLTFITLLMAGLLVRVLVVRDSGPRSHVARVLSGIGKYSYAIYVFQQPVILGLSRLQRSVLAPSIGEVTRELLVMLLGSAVSFGLALISWHVLERHALALKRHFT